MRRALGLEGELPRSPAAPAPVERTPMLNRPKRRFVADGEIPVVHGRLQRRDEHGGVQATPAPNRIEAAEAAARLEREAREKAERSLVEAQAAIHDLQTRLGHAQLAAAEANNALAAERAAAEALRAALREAELQVATARAERDAAEQKTDAAEQKRDAAEQKLQMQAAAAARPAPRKPKTTAPEIAPKRRGRPRKAAPTPPPVARKRGRPAKKAATSTSELKPIRWWLKSKTKTKRRR